MSYDGNMRINTDGDLPTFQINKVQQAEAFVKGTVLGKEGVSSVNPGLYAGRFVAFLEKHTV